MGYIASNLAAIGAATVAGLLFGLLYLRLVSRLPPATAGEAFGFGVLAAVAEFWLACILAGAVILAPRTEAGPWTMALASAGVIWVGFVLPTLLVSERLRGVRLGNALLDGAHWLAVMLIQAAVLNAVGLVKPV